MNESWTSFTERIDTLLGRFACELVLDASSADPGALRAALTELANELADPDWPQLAPLVNLVAGLSRTLDSADQAPHALAAIEAEWNAWKAAAMGEDGPVAQATVSEPAAPAPEQSATVEGTEPVAGDPDDDLEMLRADPDLASMFIAEALDHLGTIEARVLELESAPDDQRLLNDVFRPFHTIKGNAGALGVRPVQEFAHRVENLLDLARSGVIRVGPAEIDAILKSVDLLTTMIGDLNRRLAGQQVPSVEAEKAALIAVIDRLSAPDQAAGGEVAPAATASPSFEPPGNSSAAVVAFEGPRASSAPAPAPGPAPEVAEDGMPVFRRRADDVPGQNSVKVDTRKLDSLVDIVGELVIVQSIIHEDPALARVADERLSRNLAQLRRITSELQRNAMSMRMVPIRQTFRKMARLVRDLSKASGKPIDLVLDGEDTELDRKVVEEINDPLMHMVRNSVDHGLESAERRRRAGKPPTGRITLRAYHQGGNIVIAIGDDGAGLDADRILRKAIAQGIVKESDNLPLADIYQLIFRPGFSTAEKVTEISGRGVGMDVVRRNIEALRGRVEIQTAPGQGTTFYIKLPLTLAIVEGLLLGVSGQRFVMPTFSVRESLRPTREQVHSVQGRPRMIQVRDALVPLVSLAELFQVGAATRDPWDCTAVVVEDDGKQIAVLVDQLLGKQEVVIKSLGDAFAHVRGVAGGAILGDGRVGLILDAGGIIALMGAPAAQAA